MYEIRRDRDALGLQTSRHDLTDDETMKSLHIGNVYRQLDPSSRTKAQDIIAVGDQSPTEVVFRVFLYCPFYNRATWDMLASVSSGGWPTWTTFENDMAAFEAALDKRSVVDGDKIYYGGFQLVPPTVYFTDDRNKNKSMANFAASLRLVLVAMRAGLPDKLKACKYAVDASYVLPTLPTLGGFLSLNILAYLNDTTNFKWLYRLFATCGPGPRSCMKMMFGKVINGVAMEEAGLIWLAQNQYKYYARLGLDPPHEWENGPRPGMRVLDIETALCWCHRYIAHFEKKGTKSFWDQGLPVYRPEDVANAGPPAWCVEEQFADSTSRAVWDAAHNEADDRLDALDDTGEEYEVEKIVTRLGPRTNKDGMFRVRWRGWQPEEDTWEKASVLREGADEALDEWTAWEDRVSQCISDIKRNKPWTWPNGRRPQGHEAGVKVEGEEDELDEEEYKDEVEVEATAPPRARAKAKKSGGRTTRATKRVKREA